MLQIQKYGFPLAVEFPLGAIQAAAKVIGEVSLRKRIAEFTRQALGAPDTKTYELQKFLIGDVEQKELIASRGSEDMASVESQRMRITRGEFISRLIEDGLIRMGKADRKYKPNPELDGYFVPGRKGIFIDEK